MNEKIFGNSLLFFIDKLCALVNSQSGLIHELKAKVQELEDKLAKNSRNSSKPPSSEGHEKPSPKSRRTKSGRKVGGQPGHEGNTLEPVENPDEYEIHCVKVCEKCGKNLEDIKPSHHECRQEFDIQPSEPIVTEHLAEVKICPYCGWENVGEFPDHITQDVQYGSCVKAHSSYFNQYHHIPFERLQEIFKDCYSLAISQGSLVNFNKKCAEQVVPSVIQVKHNIIDSSVAQFDESGMRIKGKLHWLHVSSTEKLTYYEIHRKRGTEAMDAIGIIPQFQGSAIHDHWKPYFSYTNCTHGLCNAHIIRELEFIKERYDQSWADKMIRLLSQANDEVKQAKLEGKQNLASNQLCKYEEDYEQILTNGLSEIPILRPSDL